MAVPWFGSSPSSFPTKSFTPGTLIWSSNGTTSRSVTCSQMQIGSYTEYLQSPQQTARTQGGSGFTRNHNPSIPSGNNLASWLNSAGIEVVRVRTTGAQTFQLQFWNGSTWTAVGSAVTVAGGSTTAFLYRWQLDFSGLGTGSGSLALRALVNDSEVVAMDVSGSGLDLTSATNIDRLRLFSPGSTSNYWFSEAFIKDGSAMSALVYSRTVNANGTDVDGTGSYTAIDDNSTFTPDTDFVTLSAAGNRQSTRAAARSFMGRNVKGVGFEARLRCGATGPTQVKPYLKISGTRYYWNGGTAVTLTTAFADYWFGWETDPSTGAAWGATNAESVNLEFGIEVV